MKKSKSRTQEESDSTMKDNIYNKIHSLAILNCKDVFDLDQL